jgi:LacI family transcriptional regulator
MKTLSEYNWIVDDNKMPKKQKITIQDIADRANVSISTVSRVINGNVAVATPKREAVLAAMSNLDYRPNVFAQGLASGQSMAIGILTQNISSPIYDAILYSLLQGLRGTGYSPIIADGHWQPEKEWKSIQILLDRRVDGLVVLGGQSAEQSLLTLAQQKPLIMVGRNVPSLTQQCILLDNFRGAYEATQYLLELGHRQIAHITGILSIEDAVARKEGYKHALLDYGITPDPSLIIEGQFSEQSGLMAVEMLFTRGKVFSAIFAGNDQMAYGARLGLFRRGFRVPDDISLIGFDDQPFSAYTIPPLATMRQPTGEIGASASAAILAMVQGNDFEIPSFEAELIIRESVARYR